MAETLSTQNEKASNGRAGRVIGVLLLVLTSYLFGFARGRGEKRMNDYASLHTQYDQLDQHYSELKLQYDQILRDYPVLSAQYRQMQAQYAELKAQYDRIEHRTRTAQTKNKAGIED
ncbi:MAG: hypothetical protein ACJ713_17440 [Candidatus Sulfotelmatobacter sp.]